MARPDQDEDKLFQQLVECTEAVSKGEQEKSKEIYDLTNTERYPPNVARMAEAIGMLMVHVPGGQALLLMRWRLY